MKKVIALILTIALLLVSRTNMFAANVTVVSDTTVEVVGVYNKGSDQPDVLIPVGPGVNAVRAQEPKPYPTGYVSEDSEVQNSVWDLGVAGSYNFQTNAPSADWIWETERAEGPVSYHGDNPLYDSNASSTGRVVVFQKKFDVVGIPQDGNLRITADNAREVWVNGTFVARSATARQAGWETSNLTEKFVGSSGWQTVGDVLVPASVLLTGTNKITILAGNEFYHQTNAGFEPNNSPVPPYVANPYAQRNPGGLIFSLNVPYEPLPGCTLTQGYWKNHQSMWPVNAIPMDLGNVSYQQVDLVNIFKQPVKGNGLASLAHQLIAAKLNIASGADSSAISATITEADALIDDLIVPSVGSGSLKTNDVSALVTALDNFNNGVTGPGHCSE